MKISTKTLIKFLTVLMVAIMLTMITVPVFATTDSGSGTAIDPGSLTETYGDSSDLQTRAGKIMGMIRNIAVIAAVIVIMVLGVKYILGSVEEKAEYKKSFMPLIIGIILVVAATSIASFIFNMAA